MSHPFDGRMSLVALLMMLTACSATPVALAPTAERCATRQIRVCESFVSERRCRCADTARVDRSLTAFGPSAW